jgi:hypothetical protein
MPGFMTTKATSDHKAGMTPEPPKPYRSQLKVLAAARAENRKAQGCNCK